MKKLFIVVIFCFTSFTISAQRKETQATIDKNKLTYSPPKHKFKFKGGATLSKLIDTNAVYISSRYDATEIEGVVKQDSSICFIRFFKDGVCYLSLNYLTTPGISEFNKTDYGRWCLYKIKGNKVIIEHYVSPTLPPHFYYNYGKINGDKICFYKYRVGRFFMNAQPKTNNIFRKLNVELQTIKVNWN